MKTALRYHIAALSLKAESLRALWRDRKGTGAIEFAIIAPLLIVAYLSSFELSVGFSVARKVARASSTVADVLTQQTNVDKATLDGMNDLAKSVMTPFGMTKYTLKTTGIKVISLGKGTVAWSRDQSGGTPYKVGNAVTIPSDIKAVDGFLVRSELIVPYNLMTYAPGLSSSTLKVIDISKTYFYRQRVGSEIKCTDCGS